MKLDQYLAAKALSIGQFAELAGVAHETIRRYVHGARTPDVAMMRRIADLTDNAVRPDDWAGLTAGVEAPAPTPTGDGGDKARNAA